MGGSTPLVLIVGALAFFFFSKRGFA